MNAKFGYFAIGFAVIGVLVLYALSITISQPVFVALDQVKNYEGRYVIVEGRVIYKWDTKNGNKIIKITDGIENLTIFAKRPNQNIEIGDFIRAIGKVQVYKGEYEVVSDNIKILKKEIFVSIQHLVIDPKKYEGVEVKVSGYVKYEPNEPYKYLYLTDNESSLKVVIENGFDLTFHKGDHVYIKGVFIYDTYELRYILKLSSEEHYVRRV